MIWAVILLLWFLGMCPSVHWLDATELPLSANTLGISHPPGQPIYMMLAGMFRWIPIGDAGFRTSIGSAVMSVTGGAMFFRILSPLYDSWKSSKSERLLFGLCIFAFAFSTTVALQAIRPELYALVSLLVLAAIALSLTEGDSRKHLLAWFLWGLAAFTHPVISIPALPFLLRKMIFPGFVMVALSGLSLLYLPSRAIQEPAWNFGYPVTLDRFTWFVRGDLYKVYEELALSEALSHLIDISKLLIQSVTYLGLIPAIIGIFFLLIYRKKIGWRVLLALCLSIGSLIRMSNFWATNPDAHGYLLPFMWMMAAASVLGWILTYRLCSSQTAKVVLITGAFCWCGYQVFTYAQELQLSRDWSPRRHLLLLASEPSPGANVQISSFSTFSLLRYAQVIEGLRPDLDLHYRGLKGTPSFRRKALTHRGTNQRQRTFWELAIYRNSAGKYTLRKEDLEILHLLRPVGWFCELGNHGMVDWEEKFKKRNLEVQNAIYNSTLLAEEPLVLNYLVHILRTKYQGDNVSHRKLILDMKALFPLFQGYSLLELGT